MDRVKSCHKCNHLKTQDEKVFWCEEGGLGGEIFHRNGNGRMTLWQKMESYFKSYNSYKKPLTIIAQIFKDNAEKCSLYDDAL